MSAEAGELRMVATDSYRLSVKETKLDQGRSPRASRPTSRHGPSTSCGRIVTPETEQITIGVRTNQVVFSVGDTTLSSRLIDGQFPNYRQLLPEQFEHELTMNTEELLSVVRRISLMAQKNAPLRLAFAEGQLTVSAQTPDVGEASDALPVPFAGEPLEIGFNPEFLIAGLESAGVAGRDPEADQPAAPRPAGER